MHVSVKGVTVPSLRERKKAETHERIAAAAWNLFERQGYDATTLAQIAEAASVSPRTLFHYFPAKEALVHPTLDAELDRLADAFARRPADEPTFTALVAASGELSEHPDQNTEHHQRVIALLQQIGRKSWAYVEETAAARTSPRASWARSWRSAWNGCSQIPARTCRPRSSTATRSCAR